MAIPTVQGRTGTKEVRVVPLSLPAIALIVILSLTAGSLLTRGGDEPAYADEAPAKAEKAKKAKSPKE